ncbi:MAG: AmmeMemoRadiSam system radical SAM enzyme [Propionibacteriaceae bacterium]|jgi:pyruvate formate lyase activating enzyme|nr:AmmeMemoRadiSam system radical SAM enzyme [Propionibacteriaceae bacterium]
MPARPASPARFWHTVPDGRVECDLCPRHCRLREGQRGFCFVRQNSGGALDLTTYGRSSGFCVDPIEKKPLNHFYPGSAVLSFGTAGCNLACQFCQNWDISAARAMDRLMDAATPDEIAAAAAATGSRSVAYTYNDPVIFAEYAIDTAAACHARGLANVAVTAGYIEPAARQEFFAGMDAANVDLKSFNPDFYRRLTGGRLETVLDTLRYLVRETAVWTEITTLVIPGYNDSDAELGALAAWVAGELGSDVPLHFTAFHPDYRLRDVPRTPLATLRRARARALGEGLRYVYTGNVLDAAGATTTCPGCGASVIAREGYDVTLYRVTPDGTCAVCGGPIAGRFDAAPGGFGGRRVPVRLN